jgi:O-antigen/teichoic acid export membrane protein
MRGRKSSSGAGARDSSRPLQSRALEDSLRFVGSGTRLRMLASVVTVGAGLVTTALTVRLLSPGLYGALAFSLAAVALTASLVRSGLGMAVARTVAATRATEDTGTEEVVIRGAITASILGSLLGALIVFWLTFRTLRTLHTTDRMLLGLAMALLLFGKNAASATHSIASGLGRFGLMEIPNIAVMVGQFATALTLYLVHAPRLQGFALGFAATGLAVTALSQWLVRLASGLRRLLAPNLGAAFRLAKLAGPYALASVAIQAIARFDVLVLGITHPSSAVAAYEPVLRLTDRALTLVPLLFITAYLPAATRLYAQGRGEDFGALYVSVSKLIFLLSIPAVLMLSAFPTTSLKAVYGSQFGVLPGVVVFLLLGYVPNLALGLNASTLIAAGERRSVAKVSLAGFVVMVVSATILIPVFGPVGAAAATSTSYVALNVVATWTLYRRTHVHPFRRDWFILVLSFVALLSAALILASHFQPNLLQSLMLSSALWIVWFGGLAWAGALRREELRTLGKILLLRSERPRNVLND